MSRFDTDLAKRSLERVAVGWTEQALRDEGHDVRDGWSPDVERHRHPDRTRRPDWVCLVDGIETVIEHTRFLTRKRGREWARHGGDDRSDPANLMRLISIADRSDPAEFDAFLAEAVEAKGDQHVRWGRGVLAVTHNLDQKPSLLRDAVERRGTVPWWRIYWIDRAPPAVLVWESPDSGVFRAAGHVGT